MKVTYDLHIHSALSPCAEDEMTPNNIVNMSVIKELDFIAITDHNGIGNVKAALEVAKDMPIILVPGIEVQTKEDVHVVCLFKTYLALEAFFNDIEGHITKVPHDVKKFGPQRLMDHEDNIIGECDYSLYASCMLSVDEVIDRAGQYQGGAIPCHLDRSSYSMIANLGFISPDLPIRSVEFSPGCDPLEFTKRHLYLRRYTMLVNSDAHVLVDISEAVNTLELKEKSIDGLFDTLFGDPS